MCDFYRVAGSDRARICGAELLACRPALLIQCIDIVRDRVSANNIRHRDSGVAEIRVDVSIEVMYATFNSDADG